jgi:hypothetical protein
MGEGQKYSSIRFSMAAGKNQPVPMFGNFVAVLENNLSRNPEISIEEGSFYEIPAGVAIEINQFNRVEFRNPSATSTMTLLVAFTSGKIHDNRAYFSGDISISDVTDAVETPAAITALPLSFLINNAAAVNKGGGKVGIPVTSQPFATGESVTIANTTNYNGTYTVDATSSANEVVITKTYAAETFDGVNDSIGLTAPRSIAADADRKELIVHNHNGTYDVYWGDANINPETNRGVPIPTDAAYIIPCTGIIYFAAPAAAGKTGCVISYENLTKT